MTAAILVTMAFGALVGAWTVRMMLRSSPVPRAVIPAGPPACNKRTPSPASIALRTSQEEARTRSERIVRLLSGK